MYTLLVGAIYPVDRVALIFQEPLPACNDPIYGASTDKCRG